MRSNERVVIAEAIARLNDRLYREFDGERRRMLQQTPLEEEDRHGARSEQLEGRIAEPSE